MMNLTIRLMKFDLQQYKSKTAITLKAMYILGG